MARIRTIKPDFWTSEQIVECSVDARLLFIGIWNFADDGGIHPASTKRLKMEVFPGDDYLSENIRRMVDELIDNGLLIEYEVENKRYWQITGWDHQRIDQPTYKYPNPDGVIGKTIRRTVAEHSPPEGKGREGKGSNTSCPHQQIVDAYHELLPSLPNVRSWTPKRKACLQARWKEDSERQNLEWWRQYFLFVGESKFLTGKAPGQQGKPPFMADLEWLINSSNLTKVIEGKYHREAS